MIASQLDGYAAQLDDPKVEAALSEGRCDEDPESAFEEGILNPLHALYTPPGGTCYLLVDALDEALTLRQGPTIVQMLSRSRLDRLPRWLGLVATARKEPDVLDRLRGLCAKEIRADDTRNLGDIERFIAHCLAQPTPAARLTRARPAPQEVIRLLRNKSQGNFLWVQQALLGIEHDEGAFDRLDDLPSGLPGLYRAFFERQFPDNASYLSARRLLEVVAAASEPLTAEQIAQAADLDADYDLPRLLGLLAAYLPERENRYVFYHKSLADWLSAPQTFRSPERNFAVSPRRGHERLASWGWREYQLNARRQSPYASAHLPTHLIQAHRFDDLCCLLCDWNYLEGKTEAGGVFDLCSLSSSPLRRCPPTIRLVESCGCSNRPFVTIFTFLPVTRLLCSSACGTAVGGTIARNRPITTIRHLAAGRKGALPGKALSPDFRPCFRIGAAQRKLCNPASRGSARSPAPRPPGNESARRAPRPSVNRLMCRFRAGRPPRGGRRL